MDLLEQVLEVRGRVEIFNLPAAWHYVRIPTEQINLFSNQFGWGLVPISATLGLTTWQTSLLPMGDKTYFIALKASVRKKEGINVGDTIQLEYRLRGR